MPKRTICIHSPAKLSIKNDSLVVAQNHGVASIPLEDIWVVIIETHQAQITTRALSDLTDAGIGVMTCGRDHMPNGLLLPLGAHSRHAAIVEDQLLISRPLKKRLWQRIVKAKIVNQAMALQITGKDPAPVRKYASEVLSGDSSNRESVAASAYFKTILPCGTRRSGPYAAAFDYGYAVLRAGVARTAVAGGWLVSRGIFHSNELNAFNLVDDLIEPFRPIVDIDVIMSDMREGLTEESKRTLSRVFERVVVCEGKSVTVQTAIERVFDTLRVAVLEKDASRLMLPYIEGLAYALPEE